VASAAADKASARAVASERRRGRSPDEIEQARAAVRSVVLDRARSSGWRRVAAYVPLGTEPGSVELLAGLREAGIEVLVPVLRPDRDLGWTSWTGAGEAGLDLGVDAIAKVDAVLVPALAIARDGTRLGRGGGSYDRALPRRRPGCPAIALLFDGELVDALPQDRWDARVDAVICPAGWIAVGVIGEVDGNADIGDHG
jgi:5-formyltetrahydrofolate cyclo-ligase